ncbi:flagellar hook-basal body protein [Heyndrickxia ginsengihumi]|uniref:flagellar hook-basal body protein n=1 Tax=Heyndrickxia ginsengihumi TaxID=363870 RepID=UPI0020415660|nr:flagellar hook-basal body protein [Heyndrickxia ginsengihumi]MCM3022134.1 flagellar hook-basal body protein [Heyndrickxia ginsengihumi]
MNRSMITATNSLTQLQKKLDIISNNIANSDTTGFKKKEATFTDLLVQQFNNQPDSNKETGRLTPTGIRIGVGSKVAKSDMVTAQGSLEQTDRSLDIAFTKENQYLKVLVQDNGKNDVQFTRDGALYVSPVGNNEMMLVNSDGNPILNENDQAITFNKDAQKYNIDQNGKLTITYANGQSTSVNLGVVSVQNPQVLEQAGNNLLKLPQNLNTNLTNVYTNLTGANRANISIEQGSLEKSNVDIGTEMTDLLKTERSYQLQTRAINIADQMMGLVNSMRQ